MKESEDIKKVIYSLKFLKEKLYNGIFADKLDCFDYAITALKEIQQYRAIGTVEECREAVEKQNLVSVVEKWPKDHPEKTRQGKLLKLFPNAKIEDGAVMICPKAVEPEFECDFLNCDKCARGYWLAEVD